MSSGFAERNWKPRSRFRSSPCRVQRAQRLPVFERGLAAPHDHVALTFELGGLRFLQILLEALEPALGDAKVRQDQLVFHRLRVARGIHRSGRVRHGRIANARSTWTSASAFL